MVVLGLGGNHGQGQFHKVLQRNGPVSECTCIPSFNLMSHTHTLHLSQETTIHRLQTPHLPKTTRSNLPWTTPQDLSFQCPTASTHTLTLLQLARNATTSIHASTALKQLSPPTQLCSVQRYFNSPRYRRQLIWSPTVSPEADSFHG